MGGPGGPPVLVDARDGARVGLDAAVADLVRVRVVYVAELHDQRAHHDAQLAIVRAIHARDPSIAIGLEMVQRPFQDALDEFVAGRIDEAELLRRVEWQRRWGFDFALYRPILEYAREHGIPVRALNARQEVTRAISRGGIDAIAAEHRAELPELVLDDPEHRAMVRSALEGHHGIDDAALERFYTAQVVWDETMAETIARYLERQGAPRRMVVLAGRMHVERGLGIPRRAARRGAEPFRVVIPTDDAREGGPPGDWLFLVPGDRGLPAHAGEP